MLLSGFSGAFPEDLELGQQVAWQVKNSQRMARAAFLPSSTSSPSPPACPPGPPAPSPGCSAWLAELLSVPPPRRHGRKLRAGKRNTCDDKAWKLWDQMPYDRWISETLIQLRVSHRPLHPVGPWLPSVAFPAEKSLIDVLDFEDFWAPTGVPLTSARLRQQQMAEMGWQVHVVHLRALHNAVEEGNLRNFIAKIASTFSEKAREATVFKPNSSNLLNESLESSKTDHQLQLLQDPEPYKDELSKRPPAEL
eukprot:GHVT01093866.1.p1 GENE.GHVT01093866.1~~GHVT01093866.1.p1  ORF type:complete len:251 (+),score=46.65 GHVT01093866.1:301-1053(+)